jgi:hypothetical protein
MILSGFPATASVMVIFAPLLSRISLTFLPCFPMMILASWVTMRVRIWMVAAAAGAASASGLAGRSTLGLAGIPAEAESTIMGADSSLGLMSPFSSVCMAAAAASSAASCSVVEVARGTSSSTSSSEGASRAWLAFLVLPEDSSAEGEEERERLRATSTDSAMVRG